MFILAANGTRYTKKYQGFLPELMEKMYKERKHYKKLMIDAQKKKEKNPDDKSLDMDISKYHNFQLVRKIQLNSAYGAIGNQYFRYFDVVAEGSPLSGQLSIRWIINHLNEFLNNTLETTDEDYIVASDTDSVYLTLDGLSASFFLDETDTTKIVDFLDKSSQKILQPFIDKKYKELADLMNAYDNKMVMERECIADKGIWTAKKRYMLNVFDSEGIRYETPKMKIMGIETTRSSTPQIVRDALKKAIRIMMSGDEDELIEFVANFRRDFMSQPVENIAFPELQNNMDNYKDPTILEEVNPHRSKKIGLVYNHFVNEWDLGAKYVKIQEGDKVKFVSLKEQNPFGCNVISFPASSQRI